MKPSFIKKFIVLEASGGLVLMFAAVAALVVENSPLRGVAHAIWQYALLGQTVHFWINDALMAVFFLLIGLEIKRERLEGHLASRKHFLLPAIAACGGVIVPALIFWGFNQGDVVAMKGWAIPTATDIAFALCVMQLLGSKVPQGLKVTLVTIAILDDLMAVMIIAMFYTAEINLAALGAAAAILGILAVLNQQKIQHLPAYLLPGVFLWFCIWQSGIHATIAGVLLAMFIPLRTGMENPPARRLEAALHPSVAFAIMPLFALANAGVSLAGISLKMLSDPITLGILLGLFFGKQIGVMLASFISIKLGICRLPQNTNWAQYYGMAVLCGIGFTMSLFIGGLSHYGAAQQHAMRLGILCGSLLASVAGYCLLRVQCNKR